MSAACTGTYTIASCEAYWEEARNIGDSGEVLALAVEAGLDEKEAAEVITGDAYQERVLASTAQAQSVGITGIPAFLLKGGSSCSAHSRAESSNRPSHSSANRAGPTEDGYVGKNAQHATCQGRVTPTGTGHAPDRTAMRSCSMPALGQHLSERGWIANSADKHRRSRTENATPATAGPS